MLRDKSITVENLTVAYDGTPVLLDADLEFEKGKITAVIGPNGAGKSTLLNAMLDFIKPLTGQVHYYLDDLNCNIKLEK